VIASEFSPRPMPKNVLDAYREEIDFPGLFQEIQYSQNEDGEFVLEKLYGRNPLLELAKMLSEKFGCPEVEVDRRMDRPGTGATFSFLHFPLAFKGSLAGALRIMMSVPDFGGYRNLSPIVAAFMEPAWAAFWRGVAIYGEDCMPSTYNYFKTITRVLGADQICWILAQSKRYMLQFPVSFGSMSEWMNDIRSAESMLSVADGQREEYSPVGHWSIVDLRKSWNTPDEELGRNTFSKAANIMSAITGGRTRTEMHRKDILRMIRSLIQPSLIQPASR